MMNYGLNILENGNILEVVAIPSEFEITFKTICIDSKSIAQPLTGHMLPVLLPRIFLTNRRRTASHLELR